MQIPFYSNTKDDLHCFQACLKSILKFYFPKKNYSFKYLDRVTAHKEGKGTWISAALIFLAKKGFKVVNIENFNYVKFASLGEKYLQKFWANEVYQTQKKFSDIKNEQRLAKLLIKEKNIKLKKRPAILKDIKKFFKAGYILLCTINPYILQNKKGYFSHLVLITDLNTKEKIIKFHDPGLSPQKNKKTPLNLFLKAMGYPSRGSTSLIAVKLISNNRPAF